MAAKYTPLTKQEFDAWAFSRWEGAYRTSLPTRGREDVFVKRVPIKSGLPLMELHIYSSLENGVTRDSGKDAVRTVIYDVRAGKPLGKESRINRVEGATTVFQRLDNRIEDMKGILRTLQFCDKCGSHMVERENRRTNRKFLGCSAFPKCGDTDYQVARYPLVDAPEELSAAKKSVLKRKVPANPHVMQPQTTVRPLGKAPVEVDRSMHTELMPENNLIPTSVIEYPKFDFEFFNPIQSTLIDKNWHSEDCNLVVGTATSTGKSTVAELCMGEVLTEGYTVIYTSPLKALTKEKYDDWTKKFSNMNVMILTGDFELTSAKVKELNDADIICMTAEMLAVRTRNHSSEKSDWLPDVGLVITDESHLIHSEERGHAVEVSLMGFTKLVPNARLLCLSATMPNVDEFKTWMTTLNGKNTHVLNSDWRPIPLQWNFPTFDTSGRYNDWQASKRSIALTQVEESIEKGRSTIVFCHDKNNGNTLKRQFDERGITAHFHNADLAYAKRMEVENWFRNTPGSVLIATSTLAYGLNTPTMDVVVLGTTRGMNDVEDMDIIQEGGRAGRTKMPSYSYTIKTKEDFDFWKKLPQDVKTGIHFTFDYNED